MPLTNNSNLILFSLLFQFGEVHEAHCRKTGQRVATKTIFTFQSDILIREIEALKKADHANVIKLLDISKNCAGNIVLVMEFAPKDLRRVIRNASKAFSIGKIRKYSKMLLLGLQYLHSIDIVHRDIKPANILVDDHDTLKICDLGISKVLTLNGENTRQVGTLIYQAPEILFGSNKYGGKVDIWVKNLNI